MAQPARSPKKIEFELFLVAASRPGRFTSQNGKTML